MIDADTHPNFTHHQDLKDLCRSLSVANIDYFSHGHTDSKQRYSLIDNHPLYIKGFYSDHENISKCLHICELNHSEQTFIWDYMTLDKPLSHVQKVMHDIGVFQIFSIRRLNADNSIDSYHFGTHKQNSNLNQRYLALKGILDNFIASYHDFVSEHEAFSKFSQWYARVSHEQFGRSLNDVVQQPHSQLSSTIDDEFVKLNLSLQQLDLLALLAKGLTTQEIALQSSMSQEAVHQIFQDCQQKLDCHNDFQLGQAYIRLVESF